MKTFLLHSLALLTLLALYSPVQAQRIHGFISSGVTLSQIEGDELKGFSKWGYVGGVGAIVGFDRHETWNLSVEALFCQRGSYNGSGDPYSISLQINYVDIPLLVHYRDPWGGMLIGLGLSYSRLVQQPHGEMLFNPNYFFPDTNDMEFLNNDLTAIVDIRFPVWRGLQFNIRWNYSLLAIKRNWEFTEFRGTTPLIDENGNPVLNPDGSAVLVPRRITWTNDCYNNSLVFRLIWQF